MRKYECTKGIGTINRTQNHILKNVMINHIYSGKLHLSVSLISSSPQNHSTYIMKVFL